MIDLLLELLGDWFVFLPWVGRKRERRKEWSGTVEAKKTLALSKHAYLVIIRTDDGQRKKVRLDRKEDFDLYEEGRRYTKKAGEDMPDPKPAV
ncbi:MAG: hypothetical protein HGA24_00115 [Candidatus Aminicenantes bacterium]|nr:hypothetical protein [Candidatus Aminicenantes bacterium]